MFAIYFKIILPPFQGGVGIDREEWGKNEKY